MSFLQKLHSFAGKIDPVVKFADKHNLTPSMMYPPDKEAPPIQMPVTQAGKARAAALMGKPDQVGSSPRRRASQYLTTTGSGLIGGG